MLEEDNAIFAIKGLDEATSRMAIEMFYESKITYQIMALTIIRC